MPVMMSARECEERKSGLERLYPRELAKAARGSGVDERKGPKRDEDPIKPMDTWEENKTQQARATVDAVHAKQGNLVLTSLPPSAPT